MFLQFIKLSPVDVMRLSLGAWWPEGRSSSSVSQVCHHAPEALARWQCDEKTVTGVIWVLDYFCSVWGRCPAERGGQTLRCAQLSARLSQSFVVLICDVTIPHWDALSQYTFYGPWIESFQDCWWDPEFPQLSQMVQILWCGSSNTVGND